MIEVAFISLLLICITLGLLGRRDLFGRKFERGEGRKSLRLGV